MDSNVILKYKSFIQSKKEEIEKEFLNLLKGLCGEEGVKIVEDIADLSSDFLDDDFRFSYTLSCSPDNNGDTGYALVVNNHWHLDLRDSHEFMEYLDSSKDKNILFRFFFKNKSGDRETNTVGEFAGPFIKRLCSLHKELKPEVMIDRTPGKVPYRLPDHRFKEYLDACSGTDVFIVLKLNQSS